MLLLTLLLPCSLSYLVSLASANYLRPLAEWGCIDYEWESAEQRDIAMLTGQYIQGNSVINDVEIYGEEMIFVAVTRRDGVPASLATVCGESGNGGRLLRPYPDWSWACSTDCNCITNAQGMVIDERDRLWVVDNGHKNGIQVCPPQLLAFDVRTNCLVTREVFPTHVAQNPQTGSGCLTGLVVECGGIYGPEQTHVYMSDSAGGGLIVYNGSTSWRLESMIFGSQCPVVTSQCASYSSRDELQIALSPTLDKNAGRFLMFRPMESQELVAVQTQALHQSYGCHSIPYTIASCQPQSPYGPIAFSSSGTMFFAHTSDTALSCWNMQNAFSSENIGELGPCAIAQHEAEVQIQAITRLKISQATGRHPEQIMVVLKPRPETIPGTQPFYPGNCQIMIGSPDEIISNTKCSPQPAHACAALCQERIFRHMC